MTDISLRLSHDQNNVLVKELQSQYDYIAQLEDKMYKANLTSLDLLKQLKAAEQESEHLKAYIIEMKQKMMIYIPAKDDQVDSALAEYINNYPDRKRLRIMFIRE